MGREAQGLQFLLSATSMIVRHKCTNIEPVFTLFTQKQKNKIDLDVPTCSKRLPTFYWRIESYNLLKFDSKNSDICHTIIILLYNYKYTK